MTQRYIIRLDFPRRKIKSIIIKKERKKEKSHQNTWTLVGALVPGVGNTKYLLSRSKHDPECWLVNRSESRSKKRRMAIVQSVAERMRRKSFGGPTIDRQPDGECSLIDPISCVSRVRPNNKPASIAVNGAAWNASSTIPRGGINAMIDYFITNLFVELFLFKEIIVSFSLLFYSKDESAYVLFFEMFGTRESGSKSRLIFDSHQLFLSFPLPFSQLYHGRDISIIFVSRARRTFRHDHKSCLRTWRKRIYIYPPRKQSTLGIDSKRPLISSGEFPLECKRGWKPSQANEREKRGYERWLSRE